MPHPLNRSIVLVRGVQLIKGYPSLSISISVVQLPSTGEIMISIPSIATSKKKEK